MCRRERRFSVGFGTELVHVSDVGHKDLGGRVHTDSGGVSHVGFHQVSRSLSRFSGRSLLLVPIHGDRTRSTTLDSVLKRWAPLPGSLGRGGLRNVGGRGVRVSNLRPSGALRRVGQRSTRDGRVDDQGLARVDNPGIVVDGSRGSGMGSDYWVRKGGRVRSEHESTVVSGVVCEGLSTEVLTVLCRVESTRRGLGVRVVLV